MVAWSNCMMGSSVSVLAFFSSMLASSDSSSGSAPKAWLHEVALAWLIPDGTAVPSSAKLGSRALRTRPVYACRWSGQGHNAIKARTKRLDAM